MLTLYNYFESAGVSCLLARSLTRSLASTVACLPQTVLSDDTRL